MAEPRSLLDPFGIWRAIGLQLEKGLVELGNRGVSSDGFAKVTHTVLGASLVARKLRLSLTQRVQELLNVPTRADIQALGERLQVIEEHLVGIAAAVDPPQPGKPRGRTALRLASPPRTRKPPPSEPAPAVVARARAAVRKTGKVRA